MLHYTANLSVQEGSYHYALTDFSFEYPNARVKLVTAEANLIDAQAITSDGVIVTRAMRTRFEQAVAQLLAHLKEVMSMPNKTSEER